MTDAETIAALEAELAAEKAKSIERETLLKHNQELVRYCIDTHYLEAWQTIKGMSLAELAQGLADTKTLATLTTEAQAMPSADAVFDEILRTWGRNRNEKGMSSRPSIVAAIEHDRLVFARRAQLERNGVRKALENLLRAEGKHIGCADDCEYQEEHNAARAALAAEPADVLDEAMRQLRLTQQTFTGLVGVPSANLDDAIKILGGDDSK